MVSMMVRKRAPACRSLAASPSRWPPTTAKTVNGNEAVVGSAAEDNASLDGMELDEEAVKAQRMVDQVQQMVAGQSRCGRQSRQTLVEPLIGRRPPVKSRS